MHGIAPKFSAHFDRITLQQCYCYSADGHARQHCTMGTFIPRAAEVMHGRLDPSSSHAFSMLALGTRGRVAERPAPPSSHSMGHSTDEFHSRKTASIMWSLHERIPHFPGEEHPPMARDFDPSVVHRRRSLTDRVTLDEVHTRSTPVGAPSVHGDRSPTLEQRIGTGSFRPSPRGEGRVEPTP